VDGTSAEKLYGKRLVATLPHNPKHIGSLLRTQIPIQGAVWDEHRVGFLEADSVTHYRHDLVGDFVWSLISTDIASACPAAAPS
jgi:hypothetical protein